MDRKRLCTLHTCNQLKKHEIRGQNQEWIQPFFCQDGNLEKVALARKIKAQH